jgi:3-deoxy-D-manno-octulosonic-acid transferase
VASAGELLQALPVMEGLMAEGVQCALTFSSVSGVRWARQRLPELPRLIVADYLPFDLRSNARRLLALLRPQAVVYVKYDLWPNLVWETRRAGIPQFLISATLQEGSHRGVTPLGRSFYSSLYGALEGIYAVSDTDAARYLESCPGHPGVETLGDTRFDSVLARKRALAPPALPPSVREGPVVVVGSSWPQDEAHVLPPLLEALAAFPDLVVLLAPHEIKAEHLAQLEGAFAGHPVIRFTRIDPDWGERPRVILVDTVGLLFGLYTYGTVAYVGGGFSTGVHNVLEPAALGVPVLFGPRHGNDAAAVDLVRQGLAVSIRDAREFREALFRLLADPAGTRALGTRVAAAIEGRAGAAQRCAERIRACLA